MGRLAFRARDAICVLSCADVMGWYHFVLLCDGPRGAWSGVTSHCLCTGSTTAKLIGPGLPWVSAAASLFPKLEHKDTLGETGKFIYYWMLFSVQGK